VIIFFNWSTVHTHTHTHTHIFLYYICRLLLYDWPQGGERVQGVTITIHYGQWQ